MMPLENQVCSLEQAKRLKELGVKQDSCFSWSENGKKGYCKLVKPSYGKSRWPSSYFSAFTVAELGLLLPCGRSSTKYQTDRWDIYSDLTGDWFKGNTEADARAKMLIYLLENGLIKND